MDSFFVGTKVRTIQNGFAIKASPFTRGVVVMITTIICLAIVNVAAALYKEKKLNERS